MAITEHPGFAASDFPDHAELQHDRRSDWLKVDWRAHQRSVWVQGGRLNLVDIGSGPAIVWVHGLGASWQSWLENIPHFMGSHRCIALDLPGHGASEMPAEEISITNFASTVDALCDELGIERASVVGNSMGGFIGAELAIRFATRVDRLVLVSAAAFWQEYRTTRPSLAVAGMTEAYSAWLAARAADWAGRPRVRDMALASAGIVQPWRIPGPLARELIANAENREGFMDSLRALANYSIREELPKIESPTLIVWGKIDPLVRVRDAEVLESLIPNSRKVLFAYTGHTPMLERPVRFNAVLDDFLAA